MCSNTCRPCFVCHSTLTKQTHVAHTKEKGDTHTSVLFVVTCHRQKKIHLKRQISPVPQRCSENYHMACISNVPFSLISTHFTIINKRDTHTAFHYQLNKVIAVIEHSTIRKTRKKTEITATLYSVCSLQHLNMHQRKKSA